MVSFIISSRVSFLGAGRGVTQAFNIAIRIKIKTAGRLKLLCSLLPSFNIYEETISMCEQSFNLVGADLGSIPNLLVPNILRVSARSDAS